MTLTWASVPAKTFDTPRVEPGARVSAASGYSSPVVVMPAAAPGRGHECDDLARGPREPSLAAHDVDERLADEGVELETRESIRSELEERGEQMVETAARARDDEHAPGAEGDRLSSASSRSVASFATGCRTIRAPALSAATTAASDAESRSPITTSTSSPSASARSRPPSAATTVAWRGTATAGPDPAATTTTSGSITRSSAGITQVRFCGSAAR